MQQRLQKKRSLSTKGTTRRLRGFVVVVGLLIIGGFGRAQSNGGVRTAERFYKNIKVLQGTPADSFGQGMHLISGSLGVTCEYCHVEGNFVSDAVKTKDLARNMITMTADLNEKLFKGQSVITCFTCHQGNAIPQNMPNLPVPDYSIARSEPKAILPSAEQILSNYIAALGGERSLREITSLVVLAEQDVPSGPGGVIPMPAEIEIYQKAPNLILKVAKTKQNTLRSGFDGKNFWTEDGKGRVVSPVDLEQARQRRYAEFYEPLNIAREYADLKVEGIEKVAGSQAYLVVGRPSEGIPVRLYFDVKSGLLVRRFTIVPTAVGNSPFQVDYADYRDAGNGVKYPYRIRMEPADSRVELRTHSTILIRLIRQNVAIDDTKFVRPEPRGTP